MYVWGFLSEKPDFSDFRIKYPNAQNLQIKWKQNNALKTWIFIFIKLLFTKPILHALVINSPCVSIGDLLIWLNHWIKSYSCWVIQNERLIKSIVDTAEERAKKFILSGLFMHVETQQGTEAPVQRAGEGRGSLSFLI